MTFPNEVLIIALGSTFAVIDSKVTDIDRTYIIESHQVVNTHVVRLFNWVALLAEFSIELHHLLRTPLVTDYASLGGVR